MKSLWSYLKLGMINIFCPFGPTVVLEFHRIRLS